MKKSLSLKIKKLKKNQPVMIFWHDAESIDEWTFSHDIKPHIALIKSVGIYIHHDKKIISIAVSYDPFNESFSQILTIPIGMIENIKIMR